MDEQQLSALKPELDQFLDQFGPLFGAEGNHTHARLFVEGLLYGRRSHFEVRPINSTIAVQDHLSEILLRSIASTRASGTPHLTCRGHLQFPQHRAT
jgi:hypothetical protein